MKLAMKKELAWMLDRMPFLQAAENRDSFFRRIAEIYPESDYRYALIEEAYNDMKDAFRGKLREGGERYFEHIRANVLILIEYLRVTDYELIIAEILHDCVEDVPSWTIARIRGKYGNRVAFLVDYMTKPSHRLFESKNDRDRVYHARFEQAPRDFFILKLPDRLHNLLTLGSCPKEKRLRKIQETREHYLRFAQKEIILYHEISAVLDFHEKHLKD